jgi:hypothetical protein
MEMRYSTLRKIFGICDADYLWFKNEVCWDTLDMARSEVFFQEKL